VTRSASSRPPSDSSVERVGRYEIILELDHSPFGSRFAAFVAEGADEGRIVSVRRVRMPDSDERDALARVALAATSIRDPRVAALLNARAHDDELVVASEYVEGETLGRLLELARKTKSPMPPAVALRIALDVATGLASAREQWKSGVAMAGEPLASAMYGGLTPAQVVVAAYGDTLLTEVGLSGAAMRLPRFAKSPGAASYRAPEMLKDPPAADARTDVFQIGILLWEMLSSRPLFGKVRPIAGTPLSPSELGDIEREIREKKVPAVSEGRPGAPLAQGVVRLAERLLEREPLVRFKDCGEVVAAFDDLPSGSVATSADVVVWVERTARDVLEERREKLKTASGDRVSLAPESRSQTARPPGPDAAIRVTLPNMPPLATFSISEAPTARRKATPPTGVPAPSAAEVKIAIENAKAEDAAEEIAAADVVSEPPGSLDAKLKSAFTHDEAATGVPVEAPPLAPAERSRVRLVVYALVVVAVAAALLWWQGSSGSDTSATAPTVTAPPPTTEPPATTSTPEPEPSATAEPEPSATAKPSAAPTTTATAKPEKPQVPKAPETAPTHKKGDFRPKGI